LTPAFNERTEQIVVQEPDCYIPSSLCSPRWFFGELLREPRRRPLLAPAFRRSVLRARLRLDMLLRCSVFPAAMPGIDAVELRQAYDFRPLPENPPYHNAHETKVKPPSAAY